MLMQVDATEVHEAGEMVSPVTNWGSACELLSA
jgi:hypothetical protein